MVVNSNKYKNEFTRYYPKKKFDDRKEAQNLHKLVTEKRHRDRLLSNKWYSLTVANKEKWPTWNEKKKIPASLIREFEKLQ